MSAILSLERARAPSSSAIAYVADPVTGAAVAQALPGATVREDGLGAAIGALSQTAAPPLLIVDISGSDDPAAGVRALVGLVGSETRVIAIGGINDVALYRALRDAGAADYLVKPVQPAALAAAVSRSGKENQPAAHGRKGPHRVFVCGARGGAGATTVAVNAAWHLSRRPVFRVALIDLDLAFGTVALALDIEPSHGLCEILDNPDRVDPLFVASAAARVSETLSVLAAEEPLESAVVAPARIEASLPRLFDSLAENAECIVLDVPRAVAIAHPGIFAHADSVVLVVEMNLAAARDAARLAMLIRETAPDCALSLIANKCGKRKGEIDADTLSRGARLQVAHQLPWDERAAGNAANAGQAIGEAAGSSPLARAIAQFADALIPVSGSAAQPSLFKRLTGRH